MRRGPGECRAAAVLTALIAVAARAYVWGQWLVPRALELAGYAAVAYGFWLAWEPLGWIAGGAAALSIALSGRRP